MPRLPENYAVWMGEIRTPEYFRVRYAVDAVHFVDEMASVLAAAAPPVLHVLHGINTDRSAMWARSCVGYKWALLDLTAGSCTLHYMNIGYLNTHMGWD